MKSGLPVLIADDEPSMRGMLSQLLEEEGYQAIEAENGDDALAKFKQSPCPLVKPTFACLGSTASRSVV